MSLDYIDPTTPPPLEWAGAIFPEPMLYRLAPLWLFLLVLVVLGMIVYRQQLMGQRGAGRTAPAIIFKEIRTAINRALFATGPATIPAGQKVVDTIKLYLGPVLAFSSDLNGSLGKLEKAIKGETEPEDHKPHAHDDHHHDGAKATDGKATVKVTPNTEGLVVDNVIQVVGPAQVISVMQAPPARPQDKHHDHGEKTMSTQEHAAAVRYALERLHEFWTINTIEPRLKAMHEALSIHEPKGARPARDPYGRSFWDGRLRRPPPAKPKP